MFQRVLAQTQRKFIWNSSKTLCSYRMNTKLSNENFQGFLSSFDTILTDCDGVLWNGLVASIGAPDAFVKLKELGKRIYLVTNNSTKTRKQYVEKCTQLGFPVKENDIISSAYVTANYLKDDLKYEGKVFVVGSPALCEELVDVGYEVESMDETSHLSSVTHVNCKATTDYKEIAAMELDPKVKCVVVGFDFDFNFMKIARATSYLQDKDCLFLATNTDEALPMGNKVVPGTGALVMSVATAAGRQPIICGKPHHPIYDIAHEKHGINKETTIMIGDRLNTDIVLAHNCGLKGLHVWTGIHKEEDVTKRLGSNSLQHQKEVPHYCTESFGTLGTLAEQTS